MPIRLQISHPDRMAIGILRGVVTGVVADRETGPLSQLFAQLMGDERPVRVFRSIHAAREWLQTNTSTSDRTALR